jgi:hypothetical protein
MMRGSLVLIGFFVVLTGNLLAQYDAPTFEDTLKVYEGLFDVDEPLHLTLKFNVKNFQKTRKEEKYQPAEMINQVNDTFRVSHPVRLKARGIYRRDHCTTPPFWLNTRYSGIEAEELQGIRRMKVVTRCRDAKQYESYIFREYLVYRIYNIVSPHSYRVRLVRLKYIDTGRKNEETEDWAFLIEPDAMMAQRLGAEVIKSDKLSMRTVNSKVMDLLAMFQYMIGNGDYSVTGRHNLKILALNSPAPVGYIPVPYDFDYTGLVNAHYAVPGESLGIASVKDRYFMGPCRSENRHLDAVSKLADFREEIFELINGFEYLDEEEKADVIGYIDGFFNEADNKWFVDRKIASTCR